MNPKRKPTPETGGLTRLPFNQHVGEPAERSAVVIIMHHVLPLLVLLFLSQPASGAPHWRWDDRFSSSEKKHLQEWIMHAEEGLVAIVGPLPYTYRVHFHRSRKGRGPTPWAHTDKRRGRAVHFHVNTAYAWDLFRKDWTASHELSHLMFPYLGREGKWFSEGLASYLQYQAMFANGTISWRQAMNKLEERFASARKDRRYGNTSIVNLSNIASGRSAFVRLYWGGAAYFLQVDRALSERKNMRLTDVINAYLQCCVYEDSDSAEEMMRVFDRIAGSDVFGNTYAQTVSRRGFPRTSESLVWLEDNPPILREEQAGNVTVLSPRMGSMPLGRSSCIAPGAKSSGEKT